MKTLHLKTLSIIGLLLFISCGQKAQKKQEVVENTIEMTPKPPSYDVQNPKSILASIAYAHGGWNDLWKKHDVEYTYDYRYADGSADVSIERYIFGSEASYGKYIQHEINVMPNEEGEVVQFYNGTETMVEVDGKKMDDPQLIGLSEFLRKANYYWFTMPYKLNDKATTAKYLGQEEHDGNIYDKVEVTYDPKITGKEQNDTYILYVNPATTRVDRFYFSLPFLGVNEPLILANYHYENINGQLIATKRSYFMPSEKGYSAEPDLVQTLTNVKFDNGFTMDNLMEAL